jgi:hypothetical protein
MAHDVRGIYRAPGVAFVTDDSMAFGIPEEEYRTSEYTPDYDDLPSKSNFRANLNRKAKLAALKI